MRGRRSKSIGWIVLNNSILVEECSRSYSRASFHTYFCLSSSNDGPYTYFASGNLSPIPLSPFPLLNFQTLKSINLAAFNHTADYSILYFPSLIDVWDSLDYVLSTVKWIPSFSVLGYFRPGSIVLPPFTLLCLDIILCCIARSNEKRWSDTLPCLLLLFEIPVDSIGTKSYRHTPTILNSDIIGRVSKS